MRPPPLHGPRPLTLHAVPQLLALLGLGGLAVAMLPVGLARGRSCLAVLRGRGRPWLRTAAQRVSPTRGVGGLRGLGRWQLLRGRLVGQAFVHTRDRGLWAERPLRQERAPRAGPCAGSSATSALNSAAGRSPASPPAPAERLSRRGLRRPPTAQQLRHRLLSHGTHC